MLEGSWVTFHVRMQILSGCCCLLVIISRYKTLIMHGNILQLPLTKSFPLILLIDKKEFGKIVVKQVVILL